MDGFILRRLSFFAGLCLRLIFWPTITSSNPFPQESYDVIDLNDHSVGNMGDLGTLFLQDGTTININDIVESTDNTAKTAEHEAGSTLQLVPAVPGIGCTSDASIDDVFDGDAPEDINPVHRRGQVCPNSPSKRPESVSDRAPPGAPKPIPVLKKNPSLCRDPQRKRLLKCRGPEIYNEPIDDRYCLSVVNCIDGKFSQVRPCPLT